MTEIASCAPRHRRGRRSCPRGQLWHRPGDGPRRTVVAARYHDRLSRVEWGLEVDLGKQKTMRTPDRVEFDAHKRARLVHTFILQRARQPVESPLGWGFAGGVS